MLTFVIKGTFTGSYLMERTKQIHDMVKLKSKMFSFLLLLGLALDLGLGLILSRVILHWWSPQTMLEDLFIAMDLVVVNLKQLISWLMGAPAGLKLNSILSQALGKFFLYHIHLWVTFLYLLTPYVTKGLELGVSILPFIGFCLQITVAQDTFNLITFHVHCFYAYARRLFLSQTKGLQSLFRLFRGKKFNPLRNRVDTSVNSVDQLFVGTLAFTILLFLYPTTLTYFVVFKFLELVINFVHNLSSFLVRCVSNGPFLFCEEYSHVNIVHKTR